MSQKKQRSKPARAIIFIAVTAIHFSLLFFVAFSAGSFPPEDDEPHDVFKLSDLAEAPEERPPADALVQTQNDPVAENIVATEEAPKPAPPQTAPQSLVRPPVIEEVYLPQNKITDLPVFDEREILRNLVYPEIARRSDIEGRVILELYINREGIVIKSRVLKESPEGRGFGEAAMRAFAGMRCAPARAEGETVAVRYRYPVQFRLK